MKVTPNSKPFEIRFCPALVEKKAEVSVNRPAISEKKPKNPFLPFDQNLFVSDLSSSPNHVVIFNKFCVIPEHLLVITREFVEQFAEFNLQDFQAVEEVLDDLKEMKTLAFYNSSADAGASQIHRHFQVIPADIIPIEEHILAINSFNEPFHIPLYSSFQHGVVRRPVSFEDSLNNNWHFEAFKMLKSYCSPSKSAFNLLWTRDWMLLVPRKKEFTDDPINSLNAMAFAGFFLVKDEAHLHEINILDCLNQVTFASK